MIEVGPGVPDTTGQIIGEAGRRNESSGDLHIPQEAGSGPPATFCAQSRTHSWGCWSFTMDTWRRMDSSSESCSGSFWLQRCTLASWSWMRSV